MQKKRTIFIHLKSQIRTKPIENYNKATIFSSEVTSANLWGNTEIVNLQQFLDRTKGIRKKNLPKSLKKSTKLNQV